MRNSAWVTTLIGMLCLTMQAHAIVSGEEGGVRGVPASTATCSSGIVVDDNSFESALASDFGEVLESVNRFSLGNVRIVAVCLGLGARFSPDMTYDVVFFDDDGGGGEPGTELGRFPGTANDVPFYPNGNWYTTYTDVVVTPGDYYIGQGQPAPEGQWLFVDLSTFNESRLRAFPGFEVWQDNPFGPKTPFAVRLLVTDPTVSRATFEVFKNFDDGNPAEVEVTIECTTGDPISQSASVSEGGGPIEFIVKDFDEGELDCEITESVPEGYSVEYDDNLGNVNGTSCVYEEVEFGQAFHCNIENTIDNVDVFVDKVWIDEQAAVNSSFLFAGAKWSCDPVAYRESGPSIDYGHLWFYGTASDPWDYDSFNFYPHYDGSICSVSERELDADILSDDSDCDDLEIFPGYEPELDEDDDPISICTIINTRIYAGIPALGEYGLALLALLMLGIGFVGYRRFA